MYNGPVQLKTLKPDVQQRVLWLHHQAFGGETACGPCKGGCCGGCSYNGGYLTPTAFREARKKYPFDKKNGFKTPTGCALPITERSSVCLGYICDGRHIAQRSQQSGPVSDIPFSNEQQLAAAALWDLMEYGKENSVHTTSAKTFPFNKENNGA